MHPRENQGVCSVGCVAIGNKALINELSDYKLEFDIDCLMKVDEIRRNMSYLSVLKAVEINRLKYLMHEAYRSKILYHYSVWNGYFNKLKSIKDETTFLNEVEHLKEYNKYRHKIFSFPINNDSGLCFKNVREYYHVIKLMLLYYRINEKTGMIEELNQSHFLKLKAHCDENYEYKMIGENKDIPLKGVNLIYLDILYLWIKLTEGKNNKIPEEFNDLVFSDK